jgi:ribosomal protein S18 acetylase RimI-like enzyme
MTPDQLESNRRVVRIAAETVLRACESERQLFTAAFVDREFAGYMIATVHAVDDRELDWMMVHPDFHGNGVADALMRSGMDWLGADRPMWLNVIQHNERAVRFYRKHGFEVDRTMKTEHVVPHFIMRRPAAVKAG